MNKFEALKQFQSWPPEWQRLCAEYWSVSARLAQEQPKAAKVAAVNEPVARTEYSLQELDYIDSFIHSGSTPSVAAKCFFKRFPESGHPFDSLKTKFHKRRKELLKRGDL